MVRLDLRDARVVVTGASAGIGAATARELARAGARVALLARRRERLDDVRRALPRPDEHLSVTCDVTDAGAVTRAFAAVGERFGGLEGVVANAGIGVFRPVLETTEDDLRALLETNLAGVVRTVREAVPLLCSRTARPGRVVLIASGAGRRGVPGLGVYSATKWALFGLADALRLELAADGIRTSVVSPTVTRTEFFAVAAGNPITPGVGAMSAERVAQAILRALRTGAPALDLTTAGPLKGALNLLFPRLCDAWVRRRSPAPALAP